jgi:hypothetical protein
MDELIHICRQLPDVQELTQLATYLLEWQHEQILDQFRRSEITADDVVKYLRAYADWRVGDKDATIVKRNTHIRYLCMGAQPDRALLNNLIRGVTDVDNVAWILYAGVYRDVFEFMMLCRRLPPLHWYWWLGRVTPGSEFMVVIGDPPDEVNDLKLARRIYRSGLLKIGVPEVEVVNHCYAQDLLASVVLAGGDDPYFCVSDDADENVTRFWVVLMALPYDLQVLVAMRKYAVPGDVLVIDDEVWVDVLGVDVVAWRETLWPGRYS